MTAARRPRALARLAEAEALLIEAWAVLDSFSSPDGNHRALRSQYSPRGVCETLRGHESPLCVSWRSILIRIAEHQAGPAPEMGRAG